MQGKANILFRADGHRAVKKMLDSQSPVEVLLPTRTKENIFMHRNSFGRLFYFYSYYFTAGLPGGAEG